MERCRVVSSELVCAGAPAERIVLVSHGRKVAASTALHHTSSHPNANSAKAGYGWAEMFIQIDGLEMPARPDFYSAAGGGSRLMGTGPMVLQRGPLRTESTFSLRRNLRMALTRTGPAGAGEACVVS